MLVGETWAAERRSKSEDMDDEYVWPRARGVMSIAACRGACLILSASRSAAWSMLSMRTLAKVLFICMESSSSDMSRLSTTLSRVVLDHESPWECLEVVVEAMLVKAEWSAVVEEGSRSRREVEGSLRAGSLPLRGRRRGVEGGGSGCEAEEDE